jgi:S-methylmethionine-dependent homocysteine/selenocysteine methylase
MDTHRKCLTNDGFKFRQIMPYKDVYDKIYSRLTMKQKVSFEHSCNFILEQIKKLNSEGFDLFLIKRIEFITKAEILLNGIVEDIKMLRPQKINSN